MSSPSGPPRFASYKNTAKAADTRNKRRTGAVRIRKAHREEQLAKRRNMVSKNRHSSRMQESAGRSDSFSKTFGLSLCEVLEGISDDSDPMKQCLCTQNARWMLSCERNAPIDQLVAGGIIPWLVSFLKWSGSEEMQFEAAWALTNIASGTAEQTRAVVQAGAVSQFIGLLSHPAEKIVEQVVWALGNISGDGPEMRDFVLQGGVVEPLINLVTNGTGASVLQNITWMISNLCRYKNPLPDICYVSKLLPTIVHLLRCGNAQVKSDACWALCYITDADGATDRIELVLQSGIIATLAHIIRHETVLPLVVPALRTIGNVVSGSDTQTQVVVDLGVLPMFLKLLYHDNHTVQREAAWAVSNIAAGTNAQIEAIIQANLIPRMVQLLLGADFKTKKEACWAVTNFARGASEGQLLYIMSFNVIPGICGMLDAKDANVVEVCLGALSYLLAAGEKLEKRDEIIGAIEECGGLEKLESLQLQQNQTICSTALIILDNFFASREHEHQCRTNRSQSEEFQSDQQMEEFGR